MMGSRVEGRRGEERWGGSQMESKGGGGAGGGGGGVEEGEGEEMGWRLESQDLRLFWLDGSQMLLPSLQFLHRGQYTGAQLVAWDRWVSGCAEMGLLWKRRGKWEVRGIFLSAGRRRWGRHASVCSSAPNLQRV